MPRNGQLIRQWKIITALNLELLPMDPKLLAEVMNVTARTIFRDIRCLQDVGFINLTKEEWTYFKKRVMEEEKKYGKGFKEDEKDEKPKKSWTSSLLKPRVTDEFKKLSTKVEKALDINFDIMKCNGCSYTFKKTLAGKIDMEDFRQHKETCSGKK